MPEKLIQEINDTAQNFSNDTDCIVVIGIGGSFLGTKAVISALSPGFSQYDGSTFPKIIYAGINLCEDYLHELIEYLNKKSFKLIIISKSGTTIEPAIAFRILKEYTEKRYGIAKAKNRIITITDKDNGALRKISDKKAYKSFIIPDNIGGRYSVLSTVGLFSIAVAGFDINKIIKGASEMQLMTGLNIPFENNIAAIYAAARNVLFNNNKTTEIIVNYNPKLQFFAEWWKQLFGESEGKENSGIFPTNANYTTDLHSLGQFIQEGNKNIFETVISIKKPGNELKIPFDVDNSDNLNYLAGKRMSELNKMAEKGVRQAHLDGDVPNIIINVPMINEYYLGQLIYFFEKSCALSAYHMGVNPFDQPGVEAYKNKMFKLLGRP